MSDTKDIKAMLDQVANDAYVKGIYATRKNIAAILAAFAERDARIAELEADAERMNLLVDDLVKAGEAEYGDGYAAARKGEK